jgi:hypothetical protein
VQVPHFRLFAARCPRRIGPAPVRRHGPRQCFSNTANIRLLSKPSFVTTQSKPVSSMSESIDSLPTTGRAGQVSALTGPARRAGPGHEVPVRLPQPEANPSPSNVSSSPKPDASRRREKRQLSCNLCRRRK